MSARSEERDENIFILFRGLSSVWRAKKRPSLQDLFLISPHSFNVQKQQQQVIKNKHPSATLFAVTNVNERVLDSNGFVSFKSLENVERK